MAAAKFYVVWKGRKRGIYNSWAECERQVKGYVAAQFKGFGTRAEAEAAFRRSYEDFEGKPSSMGKWMDATVQPIIPSVAVDSACVGPTGPMEYRGVLTDRGRQIFHAGPFPRGTNNIGEFLAIVHALDWLVKNRVEMPVYSDSENAIAWVHAGRCQTKLKHEPATAAVFALIRSAENWLAENELRDGSVRKWDSRLWGEIPADFARK